MMGQNAERKSFLRSVENSGARKSVVTQQIFNVKVWINYQTKAIA
jgi:hypothetical protein